MATNTKANWQPDWMVPPGEVLAEALEERSMSQAELARRTDRPMKTINEIVKGKVAITPETAIQLELALGIGASFWNNLEGNYRAQLARSQAHQQMERDAGWISRFPVQEMVKRRILSARAPKGTQLTELLRFFGVSSPAAWERHWSSAAAAFRQSSAFKVSPEAVAVWLRIGEREAAKIDCAPFDSKKMEEALPTIRRLTRKAPLAFRPELEKLLADCGVALVLTPELPGTHLSGATKWLSPKKVLVQLSLRHKSDDQFWFALFHELGHVLRGGRRQAYLDSTRETPGLDGDEADADHFARDQLIPPDAYQRLGQQFSPTADLIQQVADEIGVSPGIVLGRLQHDRPTDVSWGRLNHLKRQFHWSNEVG